MEEILVQLNQLTQGYLNVPLGTVARVSFWIVGVPIALYVAIWALERLHGTRTNNYRTRGFVHDLIYWIFGKSPLFRIVIVGAALTIVGTDPKSLIDPPFARLPIWVQIILFVLINDFLYYWWHRAAHHFKFLWAFHAVHHSQRHLTFATSARFHPVELLGSYLTVVVPGLILGFSGALTLILIVVLTIQAEIEHTQLPWRFGPLYRVFVSPVFHSYHHGLEGDYRDVHFGQTLVIWDHLFGTAARPGLPPPVKVGLVDMNPRTFVETLVVPFQYLWRTYSHKRIAG